MADASETSRLLAADTTKVKLRQMLAMFPLPYGRILSNHAFLAIFWDFCVSVYREFMVYFASSLANSMEDAVIFRKVIDNAIHFHLLFYPVAGMIADVWCGRYIAIKSSWLICLFAWILSSIGFSIMWFLNFENSALLTAVLSVVICTFLVGLAGFQSNILAFNIDQLTEASSDELSAIVYWHAFSYYLPRLIAALVPWEFLNIPTAATISIAVSGSSLMLILLSHHFFHRILDKTPQITNPISLVLKVLNYARKTRHPRNRSALTYWENECPSRINLGKSRYGGPFTEEQVEDVKMTYKILPVFISVIGCFFTWDSVNIFSLTTSLTHNDALIMLYLRQHIVPIVTRLCLIIIYQFILHPFLLKYIPKMLNRIVTGLAFAVLSVSLNFVIVVINQIINTPVEGCPLDFHSNSTSSGVMAINYKWFIVPQVICGISLFLVLVTSIEFTIAQSPQQMRGLMIGLWYAAYGSGELLAKNIVWPFRFIHTQSSFDCLCCYFLFCNLLVFVILIGFVHFIKHYKFRVRNYTVPVYQLVEENTEKYLYMLTES